MPQSSISARRIHATDVVVAKRVVEDGLQGTYPYEWDSSADSSVALPGGFRSYLVEAKLASTANGDTLSLPECREGVDVVITITEAVTSNAADILAIGTATYAGGIGDLVGGDESVITPTIGSSQRIVLQANCYGYIVLRGTRGNVWIVSGQISGAEPAFAGA